MLLVEKYDILEMLAPLARQPLVRLRCPTLVPALAIATDRLVGAGAVREGGRL
jgi:hypothetical protein